LASLAGAQEMRVLSEFRRVDAAGEIVGEDRGGRVREILSPAVPRNAFASYRIQITLPPGSDVWLEVGQNPEHTVKVTLYEEDRGPDGRLREVIQPYKTRLAPGVSVTTLWMDLWVPPNAVVDRIKVEPQLYFDGRWYTYPMELRIAEARVPEVKTTPAPLPPDASPADASVRALLVERFCGAKPGGAGSGQPSTWQFSRRNAAQDLALAGNGLATEALLAASGAASVQQWCKAKPTAESPEWYLKVRDHILRKQPGEKP
jgi:hypothetical protein